MRRSLIGVVVVVIALIAGVIAWHRRGALDDGAAAGSDGSAAVVTDPFAARRAAHAAAMDTPAAPASLSGTVTRKSDGAPVPGAVVALTLGGVDMLEGDAGGATVAIADDHGAWTATPLDAATFAVTASAPGYASATQTGVAVARGEHRTGVALVLDAGAATLTGNVADVGGGPIPGARVTATRRGHGERMDATPALVALAGRDGAYALALPDGDWTVTATHDDYTRQRKQVTLAGAPKKLDFSLLPGAVIHGVVVARGDGKPVPGAIVTAARNHRAGGGGGGGELTAICDDKGAFQLRGVHAGSVSLTARGKGFASAAPVVVDVGIGESFDDVRVVVDRAFSISGYVVRKGKPAEGIAGVRVAVFALAEQQTASSREASGADGYFEVVGVRPASYLILALGNDVTPEMGKSVQLVDRDLTDVIVEMQAGATLSGRLEPPQVARLSIEPTSVGLGNIFDLAKAGMIGGESDASGAFSLAHVPAGAFTLVAAAADGHTGKLAIQVADLDQPGLVVPMEARAALAGRVVDANHAAVAGATIDVSPVRGDPTASMMSMMTHRRDATTADDGSFRVVGLDAGKVEVHVRDARGRRAWAGRDKPDEPITFEVVADKDTAAGTLVVEAADGVIRGTVADADGKPVADAWVSSHRDEGSGGDFGGVGFVLEREAAPPVLTGADGAFVIEHLRRGTYDVAADGPRGASHADKHGVRPGDTLTLTLASLGSVTGHVLVGGGPAPSFDVTCTGAVTATRHSLGTDGAYVIDRLAPGHYRCDATADAGTATGSVDVPAGPATLELAIVPWASVTGVVVSAISSAPVPGLKLLAQGAADPMAGMTAVLTGGGPQTDAAGRFVVERLGAGSGSLVVFPASGAFEPLAHRELTLVAGQRLDLGVIKIVPPRNGDAGTLGMSESTDGGALVVATVQPGGPAAAAGVVVGDKIVSIDGAAVADFGADLGKKALGSGTIGVGQTFALGLDRGGTTLAVSVTAVKW